MEDMAPALIEKIQQDFERRMKADPEIAKLLQGIVDGSRSYTDALNLGDELGKALADTFVDGLTGGVLPDDTLYYNIARRMIDQVGGGAFDVARDAAVQVQQNINRAAGLGLNSVKPDTKAERLHDLVNAVSGKPLDECLPDIKSAMRALPQGAVSDTMQANMEFQGKAGLRAHIVRTYNKSKHDCEYCARLAGSYEYPLDNTDVYRRHPNCRCKLEYITGKKAKTLWSSGDKAQQRAQEQAKEARIEKYNAMTAAEKKKADAQEAARKKIAEKQQWTAEKNGATIKNEQEPTNATPSHRSFKSNELLQQHFEKHRQEYGTITEEEYLSRANALAAKAPESDVVQLQRSDGSISKYCYSTNDFIVINADGTVRTFFKPENGKEYWKYEIERNE